MLVRCKLEAAPVECTVLHVSCRQPNARQTLTAFTADSSLSCDDVGFFFLITTESQSCPPLRFMLLDCSEKKGRAFKVLGLQSNGVNTGCKGGSLLADCTEGRVGLVCTGP